VVLLEDIEKAHPDVLDAFQLMFEKGYFTDARGRLVNLRNIIFILTSTVITLPLVSSIEEYEEHVLYVRQSLCDYFRPGLVDHIREIILFKDLDGADLFFVGMLHAQELGRRLSRNENIQMLVTDEALGWLVDMCGEAKEGARAMTRVFNRYILEPLTDRLLMGDFPSGSGITVDLDADKLVFSCVVDPLSD
jgi:ATP-dependent Clp protease ATP-binding subunit ClpA